MWCLDARELRLSMLVEIVSQRAKRIFIPLAALIRVVEHCIHPYWRAPQADGLSCG
jgi:hypothetical protein